MRFKEFLKDLAVARIKEMPPSRRHASRENVSLLSDEKTDRRTF